MAKKEEAKEEVLETTAAAPEAPVEAPAEIDEVEDVDEAPVEEGSELAKKTRQELADLDDLDI